MLTTIIEKNNSDSPDVQPSPLNYVLLPGSWHGPESWELLRHPLEEAGHKVVTPLVESEPSEIQYDKQAKEVAELIDDPSNTILVAHSRNSNLLPRVAEIQTVRGLVYICPGFDPINNENFRHQPWKPWDKVPDKYHPEFPDGINVGPDGLTTYDPDYAREIFYHDCSEEVRETAVRYLRPMYRPDSSKPIESWPAIPAAIIYALDDRVIRNEYTEYISRSKQLARSVGHRILALEGGHFPQLAQPGVLAERLIKFALKTQTA